ncbi:DUF4132 domain-containing protein [Spirillospora sp. NPDC029432]|uniref:DUF4132 domain-containing protein n=1 Tax=Spirillospora sp. NPDC029432 TaxID=3154599 RepID=UPI003455C390
MSENALVLPDHQRSHLHPRRGGGTPAAPAAIDPTAAERLRKVLAESRAKAERLLSHGESSPELVEPARAHLDGTATPTGAAVLAAAAEGAIEAEELADAWTAEHGPAFAAAATAGLARVRVEPDGGGRGRRLRLVRHDDPALLWGHGDAAFDDVAPRVRALIAAAGDEEYRDVVEALAECRQDLVARIATAFLAPSETGWVDDLCAELPDDLPPCLARRVMCSLGTPDQVARFRGTRQLWDRLVGQQDLYTAADGLGPALVPLLADLIDRTADPRALEVMGILPSDEALKALVERLDRPGVHAVLVQAAERFPERGRRALRDAADSGPGEIARYAARLLGGPAVREAGWADEAALEDLPSVLADPPWAGGLPDRGRVTVKGLEPPVERTAEWEPGERERWSAPPAGGKVDWEKEIELFRDRRLPAERQWELFLSGPEEDVRPLLARWRPGLTEAVPARLKPILARFSADAAPAALDMADAQPAAAAELLLPFCDAGIAARMAEWRLRRPALRPVAERWFARHAGAAARALVPAALSAAKKAADRRARRDAETALVHLASHGHAGDVLAAGREHGAEAAAGIEALVALDPMAALLPARIPGAPGWLDPYLLPQVLLRDGRALPGTAAGHLVTLLTVSEFDDVHPGVDAVREACEPASLAAFAWRLFELSGLRERGGGRGLEDEGWVMTALGLLGDDTTARGLEPVIRRWPGMNGNRMAVAGLDALVAIGTDAALGRLNGIAERIKYKGLRGQARDRITALAADRGLSAERLADRLVPDLGLDAAGTLVLDYGPRRFTAGFDERLKPFVLDGDGRRRASLPKPGARDDAELAPAAYKRFTELKKEARATAAAQLERLERAMVTGRRWSAGEFSELIAGHPLIWHIARRLLWTSGDRTFRIAEDRSLADVHDTEFTLAGADEVGLVHPLSVPADELAAWSDVFADYEISQPFPQIGRPVHALTESERAGAALDRFRGLTVTTGAVQGMERRGWDRGVPQDNGLIFWISRRLPGARTVVLDLDPGISVVAPGDWPEQRIEGVRIIPGHDPSRRPGAHNPATFADLDAMNASELLNDILHLTDGRTAT